MINEIAIYDIQYEKKNSGPSPYDNLRTELYFAGCNKAACGNPCPECFNPMIWNRNHSIVRSPQEFVDCLEGHNIPRYITIVGGEPTDQLQGLMEFGMLCKEKGYHIILFSWHNKEWLEQSIGENLIYFDIVVPGQYEKDKRIYDESRDDGIHNMIGSGNQLVWLPKENVSFAAADIDSLTLSLDNTLGVTLNDGTKHYFRQ